MNYIDEYVCCSTGIDQNSAFQLVSTYRSFSYFSLNFICFTSVKVAGSTPLNLLFP